MNRTARRAFAKKPEEMLGTALAIERDRVIRAVVHQYSVAVAMTAYDKLGFDKPKLEYLLEQVLDLFDSVSRGYVEMSDIETCLKDEVDIVIR